MSRVVKLVILFVGVVTMCITKPCHGHEYYHKHPRIERPTSGSNWWLNQFRTQEPRLTSMGDQQYVPTEEESAHQYQQTLRQKAYLLAMLNGFRGKRSEMKSEDHLTLIEELGDLDERPKKYNRARVLLGKRNKGGPRNGKTSNNRARVILGKRNNNRARILLGKRNNNRARVLLGKRSKNRARVPKNQHSQALEGQIYQHLFRNHLKGLYDELPVTF